MTPFPDTGSVLTVSEIIFLRKIIPYTWPHFFAERARLLQVITRRPQAGVVISGYEIATVAARLRNDAFS